MENLQAFTLSNDKIGTLKQQFIYWMEYRGWSTRTIESYNNSIQHFIDFIQPEPGWRSLAKIKPHTIYKYQHELFNRRLKSGRSISLATIHTNLVAVRSFLNFLYLNKKLNIDPHSVIKLPVKRQPLPKNIINEDQVSDLLAKSSANNPLSLRKRDVLELLYASVII